MSNTSNASKNVKRFLLLFALGIAYGFMYVMPYMKSSFYDQMIAAMGCTNAQLGSLMTAYCICCTVSYLPGGWIGDKFNPKPVLLISIFGQAALSFLFMFTYKSYTMAVIIWLLMGLTGGFAFWPAIMKGIRMTGTDEEQGRMYGIFEALNGLASLLLSFIMIGVMAVVGGSDLITGFKSALAFMGGLSIVSGILVAVLMPKDAAYGVSEEEKENQKKITFKDYVSAFKIPGVWIMAILVWCYVTISAVASYLTPYSTGVLGMSATLAATIGTFRTYGCRLIGGPLGGYLADKAFKSVSKEQLLGQLACLVTIGIFLVLPGGTSGGLLVFIIAGASTFLGMAGKLILPDLSSSNNVIAALVVELFPHGLKGLVLIGVLSAIMSTADISVLTGSASLTKDIYQRYINPNASEKTLLHVGLGASLFVGVLGAIFGWFTQDIMNILLITFTINSAGLFLPTIGAFFWKKSCSAGAFASMLSATVIAVVWFIGGKVSALPLFSIDALWPSFGVSAILYVVICLTHHQTPAEQETAEKFYAAK